ncbi:collagen alpha-1(II) chain-like [Balaenoptera musculus]|uniref:Collagen alpha-1(II) chain-like n=1 Tax=Balaenoptera musculus TaxID=9771 RepID=A0A8B8Z4Q3_BALMU|nr:collagen alpha-1(II) chain-like [Balaenoptera musculus]
MGGPVEACSRSRERRDAGKSLGRGCLLDRPDPGVGSPVSEAFYGHMPQFPKRTGWARPSDRGAEQPQHAGRERGPQGAESAPPSRRRFSLPRLSPGAPATGKVRGAGAGLRPPPICSANRVLGPPLGRGGTGLPWRGAALDRLAAARVLALFVRGPALSSPSPGICRHGSSTRRCGSRPQGGCGSWFGSRGRPGPPGRGMLEPLQGAAGLRGSGNRQGGDARVCPAEAATRARLLGLGRVLPALIRGAGPPGPRQAACWISELYSPAVLCQSALSKK